MMGSIQYPRWLEERLPEDDDEKDTLTIFSAVMTNVLLFFLIFGLSATVEVRNLRHQLTNKFAIFTGVAMQFVIMPFLGFCAVVMLKDTGFTEAMGITLLVVTASPGGSYSNWWCSLFNAELALSVAMTSVSSILSIGLLPANLFLYSWLAYTVVIPPEEGMEDVDLVASLDFGAIFITLGVVMGGILSGLYVGYQFGSAKFHKRANAFGSFCGIALILFSIFLGGGAGGAETNFWSLPWSFYVGVAFPCVIGMTLANMISRSFKLAPPETVAISIECCYQNTAIATSVAVTMFSDPTTRAEAVSVPLFYGVVEAFIIGVYCVWAWKVGWTKAPANEKLCVVITKTYEVEDEEEIEFDSAVDPAALSWWKRLFVPRDCMSSEIPESSEKAKEGDRDRFYSADVTVATSVATSPSTSLSSAPDTSLEPIPQENAASQDAEDLEAPSLAAPAIGVVQESVEPESEAPEPESETREEEPQESIETIAHLHEDAILEDHEHPSAESHE
jgi:predicted Na+-dependent transporter